MKRVALFSMPAAFVLATFVGAPLSAASTPSRIDLAICPNITTTSAPRPPNGPSGCGPGVFSAGSVVIQPGASSCTTTTPITDLGSFLTTQKLGAIVHAGAPNSCATNPPTMGVGAPPGSAVNLSVAQEGYCRTTRTISAQTGQYAGVVFPIGSLPLGAYVVTVTFPEQTGPGQQGQQPLDFLASHASGTLRVGTRFTETDTRQLVRPGKSDTFAVLLSNSAAGPGAGRLVSTNGANPSIANLTGTDYYACGTIRIAETITYGKPSATGIASLKGHGNLVGGTGNYQGIEGAFTLTGSYSTKTNRGTFVLSGTATY